MGVNTPNLSVSLGRLVLRNPVMVASGTMGYGLEYARLVDLSLLGALVLRSLTLEPQAGYPPPRVAETPAGMVHALGLQNEGVESFLWETLPRLRELGVPLIASLAGNTAQEYRVLAQRLNRAYGIAGLELNLAWQVEQPLSPQFVAEVISMVRRTTELPIIAKLPLDFSQLISLARSAMEAGADALCLIQSPPALAVDPHRRRFRLAHPVGGLSGPALKPLALWAVQQVHQALPAAPLIGVGGITSEEDAIEFLLVGASAIQVGTATYLQPTISVEILQGLQRYLAEGGFTSICELVGAIRTEPLRLFEKSDGDGVNSNR